MQKVSGNLINNKNRWFYVLLGNLVMMCIGTVYSWSVFRIPVENLYKIGATESGLPYMVSLSFYALFVAISGRIINKISPRIIMFIGAVLIAIGWIVSSFAINIYLLTLSYGVISGVGVGIVYGVPLNVVSKWFPDKKGLAVGLVLVGFGLSPLLTAPIASYLIEKYGILDTFMILGVAFFIVISSLSLFFKYPDIENKSKNNQSNQNKDTNLSPREMVRTTSFKILYFNFLIGTIIGLMLIGMTSKVGSDMLGISSKRVTDLMLIFAVFNGLGRPVFGFLTDKISYARSAILSYGLIIIAAVLILFGGSNNIIIFAIAFSLFWFNLGGWLAIAPTATTSLFGAENYGQNYGIVFTAYGIGAVLGVMGSGMIVDMIGSYYVVFYMVIGLCLLGMLVAGLNYKSTI